MKKQEAKEWLKGLIVTLFGDTTIDDYTFRGNLEVLSELEHRAESLGWLTWTEICEIEETALIA